MAKVLLVEDDPELGFLYDRCLKHAGFEVELAITGSEALELARAEHQLILLDIMLPDTDGIEVLKHLKSDPTRRQIPVVMMSNMFQPGIYEQTKALGAADFLHKVDIDPLQLGELLRAHLANLV